jgi:excisionase family DNA binding protein
MSSLVLVDQWGRWQYARGLASRTVVERRRLLLEFRAVAEVDPALANHEDVMRFLVAFRDATPSTRANYYGHLRNWFRWLTLEGHRSDNPCDKIPSPRMTRRQPRPVTDDQIERLLATGMYKRTRTMVLLAAYQGLRAHEIAKIRGEEVNVQDNLLRVVGKGGFDATLPLHPVIAGEAAKYPKVGFWFPAYDGQRSARQTHVLPKSVSRAVSNVMTRAGIDGGPHRLRHWFATGLVKRGVDIRVVQELLRHASLQSTQIYTGVTLEQQRAGIDSLGMPASQAVTRAPLMPAASPSAEQVSGPGHASVAASTAEAACQPMLTTDQAAKVLGVNRKTVWRAASQGRIDSLLTPGGHRRFREADIRALLQPAAPPGSP